MFNLDKAGYFDMMDSHGIQLSAMGDIMIDEIMMMNLQEMVGLDIKDGGSVDTDKVLELAEINGFRNLGGFGGSSVSQEDNYVFHMSCDEIQEMEKSSELVRKAVEVASSYMELGYYIENKTYELEVEVTMSDTVRITASNEQEAKDKFLNDVVEYSGLGELVGVDYYNGITKIEVKEIEENFLK